MKYKTTAKAVRNGYPLVFAAGYCSMQNILSLRSPVAYASGVYGRNFDVYDVGDIIPGAAVCTGYRGMPAGIPLDGRLLDAAEGEACGKRADREALDGILRRVLAEASGVRAETEGGDGEVR
mgnify:FL=1